MPSEVGKEIKKLKVEIINLINNLAVSKLVELAKYLGLKVNPMITKKLNETKKED